MDLINTARAIRTLKLLAADAEAQRVKAHDNGHDTLAEYQSGKMTGFSVAAKTLSTTFHNQTGHYIPTDLTALEHLISTLAIAA